MASVTNLTGNRQNFYPIPLQYKIYDASLYFHVLDNLSAACSSVLLMTSDGESTTVLTVGVGDDDEVTTSAGKKRKHWIKPDVKG